MQLALFVRTRTKPGQRELVRRAWEEPMKPGVDGNAQQPAYVFCEDKDDDDVFCLFESYQTQGSFEQASESSRFADYMARIGHMLNGPPVVNLTTPAWGKGVSDQDMQRIS